MRFRLPGLRWGQFFSRVYNAIWDDAVFGRSAQLSYYFLLSIFPLMLLLTAVLGLFAEPGTEIYYALMGYIRRAAPGAAGTLLGNILTEVTQGARGFLVSVGALTALWSASAGMRAIMAGLNAAYNVPEARVWWRGVIVSIVLTVAVSALMVVALVTLIWGGRIGVWMADRFGLGALFETTWNLLHWPLLLAFLFLAFMLVYRYAPNVRARKWGWNAPGALVGIGLWLLVSFGLRIYIGRFADFNRLYGSLGAVIILMLWLYLSGAAILIGGEVNGVIADAAARAGEKEAEVHRGDEPESPPRAA
jgi:membrane protein